MPKTVPPPHPKVLGAQRFFARVRAFDLECPHCGLVYQIRLGGHSSDYFDPRTGRFTCHRAGGCNRSYTIGLLAWPVGTNQLANTPPMDQVLGPRQLAQVRAEGDGWWLPDEYKPKTRPDPTNLTGELDRPEPEDPIDLQLIDPDEEA